MATSWNFVHQRSETGGGALRRILIAVLFCAMGPAGIARSATHTWPDGLWDVVTPEETAEASGWFDHRIAALGSAESKDDVAVQVLQQGWGVCQSGWSVNRTPLTLSGKPFLTGFGTHTDSMIRLTLPAGATRLSGSCGVNDTPDTRQNLHPVIFTIAAGDKQLWQSKPLTSPDAPADFDLDITGTPTLTLEAHPTGDASYTPADWVQLQVTRADKSVEELGQRRGFFEGGGSGISFVYHGIDSQQLLAGWQTQTDELPPGRDGAICKRVVRTDPATGLQCIVEMKRYEHFPVVEWTTRFKNTGSVDTPVLENIRSMDVSFPVEDDPALLPPTVPVLLHHNVGDHAAADGYEPIATPLGSGDALTFAPDGGRPTDHAWPYYNLELPTQHRGLIAVVSWPAEWSATIARPATAGDCFTLTAGQQLTHLKLHPGEEIRTPLSVVLFYHGDADQGQNLWRRWMISDNVPRPGGQLPPAIHSSAAEDLYTHQQVQIDAVNRYVQAKAGLNYWWLDAGWYPCADHFWWNLSSWDADPARYPGNLKALTGVVHANGMKQILWFEPERAHVGGWLWNNHPEWLLIKKGLPAERLLDLGNPAAWHWLVDKIDGVLTDQHVDVYRQDFNFEPLEFWRQHDPPDRQGITEIRHVEGYLAFWDELLRRHPALLIDTCASGGRRLDLETLRRSISLWDSDDSTSSEDQQSHTAGIAAWVPYFGSGAGCDSAYAARSLMMPFLSLGGMDKSDDPKWDLYRRETHIWDSIRDDMLGDFYPLLPHTLDNHSWMAWQFDRPESGRGVVQVFRRPLSPYTSVRLKLRGLDPAATYRVTNVDAADHPQDVTGNELTDVGLDVQIPACPAAQIVTYTKE